VKELRFKSMERMITLTSQRISFKFRLIFNVQVSGKVSTSIRFAIIVKWITQDLFEFYPNPDGSFLIELSEPGTYTLQSSINPSVNVKVIVYSIVKNEV
jgi:hypothetical protein